MKFTSEDLMKAMGLNIGDTIKIKNKVYTIAKSQECAGAWIGYEGGNDWHNLSYLINGAEYEILPKPKRVGDLMCSKLDCAECPLRWICDTHYREVVSYATLYEVLDLYDITDTEIHDLLKARLDKVVE